MKFLDRLGKLIRRPYRDFTLVQLNHLRIEDLFDFASKIHRDITVHDAIYEQGTAELRASKIALDRIKEGIEYGKKIIDENSKPGDIVMLESPEEWTFESFMKMRYPEPIANRQFWEAIIKHQLNMYHELAKYAESHGRQVLSLEQGVNTPNSRLSRTAVQPPKSNESEFRKHARIESRRDVLAGPRRDISFQRKIQAKKPALVIAAMGHAAYLYKTMKPKNMIWHGKAPSDEAIESYLRRRLDELRVYYTAKEIRRKKAAQEKKLKFKRIKRPKA
ncbi:MAG: hypothetical protein Q7K34_01930 [archaeon]|nr:hypothetical protein [archaeon]